MNLVKEIIDLEAKISEEKQKAQEEASGSTVPEVLTQSMTSSVLHMKRLLNKEPEANNEAQEGAQKVTSAKTYMQLAKEILTRTHTYCDEMGLKIVQQEKVSWKDQLARLGTIFLGSAEGKDWHTGLPAVKAGKTRPWSTYSAHATETLLKFAPAADLNVQIALTEKALSTTLNMILTNKHFLFFRRADGRTGGRADGRAGGRADGRTDGRADGRTGGRTGGRAEQQKCSWLMNGDAHPFGKHR